MKPFVRGFSRTMKLAGLGTDLRNVQREYRGEETDADLMRSGAGVAAGAALMPGTLDDALGLQRMSQFEGQDLKGLARLKDYYTGARIPESTALGLQEGRRLVDEGATQLTPDALRALGQKSDMLEGGLGKRTLNVLGEALDTMPRNLMRHPIVAPLALGGLGYAAYSAGRLGKGIHEREFGGAAPIIGAPEAAALAGGLGGLGAAGYGLHQAHQKGMLPSVSFDVQMPSKQANVMGRLRSAVNAPALAEDASQLLRRTGAGDSMTDIMERMNQRSAIPAVQETFDALNDAAAVGWHTPTIPEHLLVQAQDAANQAMSDRGMMQLGAGLAGGGALGAGLSGGEKTSGVREGGDPKKRTPLSELKRQSGDWAEILDEFEDDVEDKIEDKADAGAAFIRSKMR